MQSYGISSFFISVDTYNEAGERILYNQFALFYIGSGNFGGKRMSERPEVKNVVDAPKRVPDAVISEQTSANQVSFLKIVL